MIYETLIGLGCNVDAALDRFVNDKDFYIGSLREFKDEPEFERLSRSIRSHDINAALDAALILKSIIGSLEITPLFDESNALISSLKTEDFDRAMAQYCKLIAAKYEFFNQLSGLL